MKEGGKNESKRNDRIMRKKRRAEKQMKEKKNV